MRERENITNEALSIDLLKSKGNIAHTFLVCVCGGGGVQAWPIVSGKNARLVI